MPHMPLWHIPLPHMPEPHSEVSEAFEAEWAAKVEYCVVRCFWPQEGQHNSAASVLRRTSFSNLVPQSSQAYSKIGIILFSSTPIYDGSMRRREFLADLGRMAVVRLFMPGCGEFAWARSLMVKIVVYSDSGVCEGIME